jgi:hypothetical protein
MPPHLEGPVSQVPWSPEFLGQTLELLLVTRPASGILTLRPQHASSLQLGWRPGVAATDVLATAISRYRLQARVLHSTSWRHDGDHVVLTYLAVVETPEALDGNLVAEPVSRADLARGAAASAPESIATAQVLEHALRHLAWLIEDDPAVAAALPDWRLPLAAYVPEPFRSLGEPRPR